MKRKHLELAAKLWGLALIAHTESVGETDTEIKVKHLAAARAQTTLGRLGVDKSEILTAEDALAVAERLRP